MSYKDDLENRKAAEAAAKAKEDQERAARIAERKRRTDALVAHLKKNDPGSIGLMLQEEGGRIKLLHANFTIVIDTGLTDYPVMVLVPKNGSPAPTIARGSQTTLRSLSDVDDYILKVMR